MALAVLGEDLDAMIALVDHALALNSSYARGWHISSFLRLWAGQTSMQRWPCASARARSRERRRS